MKDDSIDLEQHTQSSDEITCPYCGHRHSDSWEYSSNWDDDFECVECDKKFVMNRIVDVYYVTEKKEKPTR
jgi:DNA-directed RNA polymerase subunit RPC12/RpoP